MTTFTVGQTVKRRDGMEEFKIMSMSGVPGHEMILQRSVGLGLGGVTTRCANGRSRDWEESKEDVVPIPEPPLEWNPKWGEIFDYAAMDGNGSWFLYSLQPKDLIHCWGRDANSPQNNTVWIPKYLAPKFTGDWRQSLITRTK